MKKKSLSFSVFSLAILGFFSLFASKVSAELTNPVITGSMGSDAAAASSGATFADYFVRLWSAAITLGGIMLIAYFIWGSIEWISAGGDAGKIEKARNRITQSIVGLVLLVSSIVIIGFISTLLFGDEFNILNLSFTSIGGP